MVLLELCQKTLHLTLCREDIYLCFPLKCLHFIFRLIIYFVLIFFIELRFSSLPVCPMALTPFAEKTFFPHSTDFTLLSKSAGCTCVNQFLGSPFHFTDFCVYPLANTTLSWYCVYILSIKIREYDSNSFFFKIALTFLVFPYNFYNKLV